MKHFLNIQEVGDLQEWVKEAMALKEDPHAFSHAAKNKTLGMVYFNKSLRTRMSTQKAASNLGMEVITINASQDGWSLEFDENVVMNGATAEHIVEAAGVLGQYCDVIGVRAFAGLEDQDLDEKEQALNAIARYSGVPVLNLESTSGHPLQALADAITITENKSEVRPKIVLSWAPHPKPLPHAVPHSFVRMAHQMDAELVITHPKGYELDTRVTQATPIEYDQEKALEGADFVYVKNWSGYTHYGQVLSQDPNWMMTPEKLGSAYFMHCLPVRRNVVVSEQVLESQNSLVIQQANNRTYAAQLVLKKLLDL